MLGYYFTKQLQVNIFRSFRGIIMGYHPITDLYLIEDVSVKERFEKENNISVKENVQPSQSVMGATLWLVENFRKVKMAKK